MRFKQGANRLVDVKIGGVRKAQRDNLPIYMEIPSKSMEKQGLEVRRVFVPSCQK